MTLKRLSFSFAFVLLAGIGMVAQNYEIILVGNAPRNLLESDLFFPWYSAGYKTYSPDAATIDQLKKMVGRYKLLVFAGTWCGDTKRELPRFFKVIDSAGIPAEDIQLIFVDRNKKSKDNLPEEFKIQSIPTFVLLAEEKEVGRIVESTKESIEKDLAAFLPK